LREGFALIPTLEGGVFTLCPLHSPEINRYHNSLYLDPGL
jgi:hypothetical protein